MSLQTFALSSEVDLPVTFRLGAIINLDVPQILHERTLPLTIDRVISPWDIDKSVEFYISCELFINQSSLTLPIISGIHTSKTSTVTIDEWITFPIMYKDITPSSRLVINIWGLEMPPAVGHPSLSQSLLSLSQLQRKIPLHISQPEFTYIIGGTTIPLFNKHGSLKLGPRRLNITKGVIVTKDNIDTVQYKLPKSNPDQGVFHIQPPPTTPAHDPLLQGVAPDMVEFSFYPVESAPMPYVEFEKKLFKHSLTTLSTISTAYDPACDDNPMWLNSLAVQNLPYSVTMDETIPPHRNQITMKKQQNEHPQLILTMPPFNQPVIYSSQEVTIHSPFRQPLLPVDNPNRYIITHDPHAFLLNNPLHSFYHILAAALNQGVRHHLTTMERLPTSSLFLRYPMMRQLAVYPNQIERHRLLQVLSQSVPPTDNTDQFLLVKYAPIFATHTNWLRYFIHSVLWSNPEHERAALTLIARYTRHIPFEDAFHIIVHFSQLSLRRLAVIALSTCEPLTISRVLLQLVQCLRYEPFPIEIRIDRVPHSLAELLVQYSMVDSNICTKMYWHLRVETYNKSKSAKYSMLIEAFLKTLQYYGRFDSLQMISDQMYLVKTTIDLFNTAPAGKRVDDKLLVLREHLSNRDPMSQFYDLYSGNKPVPLPIDTGKVAFGLNVEKLRMFKSAKTPLLLTYYLSPPSVKSDDSSTGATEPSTVATTTQTTSPSGPTPPLAPAKPAVSTVPTTTATTTTTPPLAPREQYRVMFKCGDDLRQDQLVVTLFMVMNDILLRYGLQLDLLTYNVLATSPDDGYVEFVPDSQTIQDILEQNNKNIRKYIELKNPSKQSRAINTYIRSCAGYTVMTYVLGIGDRHLENILITDDAQFFHIDFGYIFGQEPKPLQPKVKLTREMVDAMGGETNYNSYLTYCFTAYNILRRHSSIIIDILYAMIDADLPGFKSTSKTLQTPIDFVSDRLKLNASDEEANRELLTALAESQASFMSGVSDAIHSMAVAFR